MTIVYEDIYQLIDGTLDRGLAYVDAYLKKTIGREIIVTDCDGFIHYPNLSLGAKHTDKPFITLPCLNQNDYFYSETEQCLYYRILCSNSSAYIVVKDIAVSHVPVTLTTLKQAKLAVKCYFTQINPAKKDSLIFEQEMHEYLFGKSTADIADILALGGCQLPSDCICCVDVMEAQDLKNDEQWKAIVSYSREFLKRAAPEAFLVSDQQYAAYIFPSGSRISTIESYKGILEKSCNITVSFGRGQPYPLHSLRRSFEEACIALHYPHIMGTETEIQCFSDLGIFFPLFSQDLDAVKMFCRKTLEPLRDYDAKNKNCLLSTLTELVNSDFNLKETAKNLFIHINTLYYRIRKIEQLLGMNLSLMNTRVNLFTAIKSLDLLQTSELWDRSQN